MGPPLLVLFLILLLLVVYGNQPGGAAAEGSAVALVMAAARDAAAIRPRSAHAELRALAARHKAQGVAARAPRLPKPAPKQRR